MSTDTTEETQENATITDAVSELQKVVSHNAQVTMNQYENLLNGTRLNNLLINAIIRKVGLAPEEVKDECDRIKEELIAQAKELEEETSSDEAPSQEEETLSMAGGEGDHPEEAIVFGDD